MATDPNEVIAQFTAALERLESRLGQAASRVQGTVDAYSQLRSATGQMAQAGRATSDAMRGMVRDTNAGRSAIQAKARFERTVSGELSQLSKAVARGTLTQSEGDETFRQMIAAVRQNVDLSATQRRDLMQTLILERRKQDSLQRSVVMQENFADAMQRYGVNAVGRGLRDMGAAYQGGAVQISNFAGKLGIQGASFALQGLGKLISNLSPVLMRIPGIGTPLAMMSKATGGALSFLGDQAEKILTPLFEFLSTEFNKQLKNFQMMSSAGAVFGDGLLGMNKAAAQAGITTDKLAEVLKHNSEDISKTGLGMAEGARLIGRVGEDLRKSGLSKQLAQLGYTAEEITDMVAQNAGAMRMNGGQATDKEIAATTAAYAKDLRTLQAITGEDVRQREKEAKARNNTLAFNQKLMEMEPAQRAKINAAMAGLSEREQAILREKIINNGQAFTKESLLYESMVDGTSEKMNDLYNAYTQNSLSVDKVTEANTTYSERQKRSIASQQELALAAELGVGAVTGVARDMNEGLNRAMKFDPENVARTRAEVDRAFSEQMEETTKKMAEYEIATKALEAELQKLVGESGALKMFGNYIGLVNDGALKFAQWLNGFVANPRGAIEPLLPESLQERNRQTIPERSLPQLDPLTQQPLLGSVNQPMTVNDPAVVETLRNLPRPNTGQYPGLASGGMVDFPTTGGLAVLHGQEAVIPLPSGLRAEDLADVFKSLKEDMLKTDTSESAGSGQMSLASISALNQDFVKRINESLSGTQEDMIKQLFELNTSMNTLIDHMRDVSNHTERTARGVA